MWYSYVTDISCYYTNQCMKEENLQCLYSYQSCLLVIGWYRNIFFSSSIIQSSLETRMVLLIQFCFCVLLQYKQYETNGASSICFVFCFCITQHNTMQLMGPSLYCLHKTFVECVTMLRWCWTNRLFLCIVQCQCHYLLPWCCM